MKADLLEVHLLARRKKGTSPRRYIDRLDADARCPSCGSVKMRETRFIVRQYTEIDGVCDDCGEPFLATDRPESEDDDDDE